MAKLSAAQDRALRQIAADSGLDLSGIRPATIGALVGAGYLTVWHTQVTVSFRPGRRTWTRTRWTRTRTVLAGVKVTDAGRAYLATKEA